MASPQKENGFTAIANEILYALAQTNLNGYERRFLDILFLKTYGWHKKEDKIANSQFVELTNIRKGHISRTLSSLLRRKIVTKNGNKISFSKNYSEWLDKKGVTILGTIVTKNGNKKLPKMGDTKESKETIQKKINFSPHGEPPIGGIVKPMNYEEPVINLDKDGEEIKKPAEKKRRRNVEALSLAHWYNQEARRIRNSHAEYVGKGGYKKLCEVLKDNTQEEVQKHLEEYINSKLSNKFDKHPNLVAAFTQDTKRLKSEGLL